MGPTKKKMQNASSSVRKCTLSVCLGNAFCSIKHCSCVLSVGPMKLLQTNEEKRRPTAQCEQCFAI